MADYGEFAVLIKVYGPSEADIIKAKLELYGITCFVRSETIRDLYGIHVNGLGGEEVLVPKDRYDEALELLNEDDIE